MTREPSSVLPAIVAGVTIALGLIAVTSTLGVIGNNPNYGHVPFVLLAPSVLAAAGAKLTQAGTTTFRLAVVCCGFVCFASTLVVVVVVAEAVAPVGDFAIAGAAGLGWFVQIVAAFGAAAVGLVSWWRRKVGG